MSTESGQRPRRADSQKKQPNGGSGRQEVRSTLSRIGHAVATGAFIAPAVGVGVAIALVVSTYTPLVFEPTSADATESQAATIELPIVDTSEVEKSEGPVEGASLDTSDLGIDTSNLKDGTYTGSGTGYSGTITVRVTISGGKITNIEVVSTADGDPYFSNARAVIQRVIDAQSVNVDTVSGATYSSRGILQAIRNALAQASGGQQESLSEPANSSSEPAAAPEQTQAVTPTNGYADGTYTGSASCYYGDTTVQVVISGGKITQVEILSSSDDYMNLVRFRTSQIVERQSANIDNVTGATYSSGCLRNAVQNALNKAAAAAGNSVTPTTEDDHNHPSTPDTPTKPDVVIPSVDTKDLKDGVYEGMGTGFQNGQTVMRVTVSDGRITAIENVSNEDTGADDPDHYVFPQALAVVVPQVIAKQSVSNADIDTVTGATYSRAGILEAIANALQKAHGKEVVDKASLAEQIAKADSLVQDDFTDESWGAYTEALEAAQALNENESATQEQVDQAVSALQDAWNALERKEEPEPDDKPKYQDGDYIGYALCGELGDDGEVSYDLDFSPYYVAVRVSVVDGVPQPVEIVDPAEQDAPVSITNVAHDGDAVLDELSDDDLADNLTYLGYALNGRTRRGTTYQSVLAQIVTYVREHGEAPSLDLVKAQGELPGEAGIDHIDQVTGATYSSKAIVAAYQDALQQAADAYVEAHEDDDSSSTDKRSDSNTTLDEPSTNSSGQSSTSDSGSVEGSASGEIGYE